jgi:long-chain acyl-CoA synthetase
LVEQEQAEVYPQWTWSWPVQLVRVLFLECVMQPLVWLLGNPRVTRETSLHPRQPLLLIANHVTAYDMPLVLYALPGKMRRHVAAAMAANMLDDWRKRRNQESWILNALGPVTYLLVTVLFNVFPLPRSAGFRHSFQHAGKALDRGYNVLVFPEGHRSQGELQKFRPGIGLLIQESKAKVLPVSLVGLGEMKQRRQRWFRSGKLEVHVGSPIVFDAEKSPEETTEQLRQEIARLLQ